MAYSDPADNGVLTLMSSAGSGTPTNYSGNEAWQVLAPNGDVIVFARATLSGSDAQNVLLVYRSVAATVGATLTFEALLTTAGTGYEGAAVASSGWQTDPDGKFGSLGRILFARALTDGIPIRSGNRVGYFEDTNYALRDELDVLARLQTSGYCKIAALFGGEQALFVHETDLNTAFNNRGSTHVSILQLPQRAAVA